MATGALGWRRVEINFLERISFMAWLVAAIAGNVSVSAGQGKRCFRVIEAFHVGPGTNVVAGLASERLAIRPGLLHSVTELALVRIRVAASASEILKAEWSGLGRGAALSPSCDTPSTAPPYALQRVDSGSFDVA